MPVFALEKWTVTKTDDGTVSLTSWQPPTNLVPGFASGKKTELEKGADGNSKKPVILHEHKFTVKNVQLYPPVGGWSAYVSGPNRTQYVLCLSEKNRLHTAVSSPVLVAEPVVGTTLEGVSNTTTEVSPSVVTTLEGVSNTTTEVSPSVVTTLEGVSDTTIVATTATKPKKYGRREPNSAHVKYVAKQTVDELHATFGTVRPPPPSQKKVLEKTES